MLSFGSLITTVLYVQEAATFHHGQPTSVTLNYSPESIPPPLLHAKNNNKNQKTTHLVVKATTMNTCRYCSQNQVRTHWGLLDPGASGMTQAQLVRKTP